MNTPPEGQTPEQLEQLARDLMDAHLNALMTLALMEGETPEEQRWSRQGATLIDVVADLRELVATLWAMPASALSDPVERLRFLARCESLGRLGSRIYNSTEFARGAIHELRRQGLALDGPAAAEGGVGLAGTLPDDHDGHKEF